LHRYSVEAMGIALIAALVAFIMIAVDRGTSRTLNNR
jgi:hypothetical protein